MHLLTRTEPAIHNPNVDGLNMISSTLRRSRAGVFALVGATPGFVASMALLALLGLGQQSAAVALTHSPVSVGISSSCVLGTTSKPTLVLPATFNAECTTLSQSASLQPEAMTSTAQLPSQSGQTGIDAEGQTPDPERDLAGSGVSALWLLPLGLGIIVLGVFIVVVMYRHRHDDMDEHDDIHEHNHIE
jgi:hypothetical protein